MTDLNENKILSGLGDNRYNCIRRDTGVGYRYVVSNRPVLLFNRVIMPNDYVVLCLGQILSYRTREEFEKYFEITDDKLDEMLGE